VKCSRAISTNPFDENFQKLEAPSSDSDSEDDVPLAQTNRSYKRNIKDDQGKRFDFLLKQTEIFSHFITGGKTAEESEEKRGRKKKGATPASTSKKDDNTEGGG
jgi:DNA-binding domain